ncbi:MAG: hypothetical protein FJY97_18235, partial [candidate division Zixibacteria bacterium]|nr:hypothetical protein [candidate division Zixibacteria bacterium]
MINGYGYSSFNDLTHALANHFPPGYPLILAAVQQVFDNAIFPAKILNMIFLGASLLLFFPIFRRL